MSRGPPAASPCRGRARCSQTRPCAQLGGGEPGMGATRSRLVRAGASPQQGLFNKIELFPSSMPPPCPGPGSAWAQRCRPRPQQGQEPQQSGLRGFHRAQQLRRGTRTAGCQGKTPMCKGGKPHPRGCGWEHPTRGSCPGDEPVPILQRGPCPAHHLCSTVIPKSELRPAGFCPISPFLAVQVVLEPLHPLPEVLLLEALRSEPERLRSQLGEEQRRERFLGAELRAGSLPDGERFDSQICGGL